MYSAKHAFCCFSDSYITESSLNFMCISLVGPRPCIIDGKGNKQGGQCLYHNTCTISLCHMQLSLDLDYICVIISSIILPQKLVILMLIVSIIPFNVPHGCKCEIMPIFIVTLYPMGSVLAVNLNNFFKILETAIVNISNYLFINNFSLLMQQSLKLLFYPRLKTK